MAGSTVQLLNNSSVTLQNKNFRQRFLEGYGFASMVMFPGVGPRGRKKGPWGKYASPV